MKQKFLKWLLCSVFFSVLIIACAGTELTPTYVDKTRSGKPVSNILVIGASHKEDMRRLFENSFVAQLEAVGVKAVSSADVIPVPADLEFKKDMVLKAVDEFKNDAVILTFLLGVDEKETFVRSPGINQSYYGLYAHVFSYVHDPGYSRTKTTVRLSTYLYDVKTEKLIWSAQSKIMKPDSPKQVIDDVIHSVINALQKNELIR